MPIGRKSFVLELYFDLLFLVGFLDFYSMLIFEDKFISIAYGYLLKDKLWQNF